MENLSKRFNDSHKEANKFILINILFIRFIKIFIKFFIMTKIFYLNN